jgi:hypothetical protein
LEKRRFLSRKVEVEISLDFQNTTVEEMFKWCEVLAFRFPAAMTQAFDTLADFSVREMELWWRMFYAPAGQFLGALWPQLASTAELDTLAAEIEQVRAQLRTDSADRATSNGAATARFDHLRDEVAALREELRAVASEHNASLAAVFAERDRVRAELQTLRDDLRATAASHDAGAEIERLRAELESLRHELTIVLTERETSAATGAATLKDFQAELRALRDRIDPPPASPPPASRGAMSDPARRRPKR